jgi:heme oxygenase
MLADQLKKDTLTNHQQLEKLLIGRMKAIRSIADYTNLLQLFYTYFGGLELVINQYINQADLPDYELRRKTEALAQDIKDLGGQPQPLADKQALPNIQNSLQAYAALYVIEGSTLGGKIISKMMAQQLGVNNSKGFSFFNGYGENTENMWETFKNALNAKAKTVGEENDIIITANQTFTMFKKWAKTKA